MYVCIFYSMEDKGIFYKRKYLLLLGFIRLVFMYYWSIIITIAFLFQEIYAQGHMISKYSDHVFFQNVSRQLL